MIFPMFFYTKLPKNSLGQNFEISDVSKLTLTPSEFRDTFKYVFIQVDDLDSCIEVQLYVT